MKFSEGKIDSKRLEEGAWVDDIPECPGVRLKVRGINNTDWRKLARKLIDVVPRKRKPGGIVGLEDIDRITSTCLENCGLLDWEGFVENDGKPIPYSKEIAHEICFDPDCQKYRDGALYACGIVAELKEADKDDIVKN